MRRRVECKQRTSTFVRCPAPSSFAPKLRQVTPESCQSKSKSGRYKHNFWLNTCVNCFFFSRASLCKLSTRRRRSVTARQRRSFSLSVSASSDCSLRWRVVSAGTRWAAVSSSGIPEGRLTFKTRTINNHEYLDRLQLVITRLIT